MSRRMTPQQQLEEKPHIVMEFKNKLGATIRIADNYCVKTQEEVDEILARCAEIAMEEYRTNPEARAKAMIPDEEQPKYKEYYE